MLADAAVEELGVVVDADVANDHTRGKHKLIRQAMKAPRRQITNGIFPGYTDGNQTLLTPRRTARALILP